MSSLDRREFLRRSAAGLGAELQRLGEVLGILQDDPERYLRGGGDSSDDGLSDEEIEAMIQQRVEAKQNKDWATADRIRDELKEQNILLEDGPAGTTWRRG